MDCLLLLVSLSLSHALVPLSYDLVVRLPDEFGPSVSFSASLSIHFSLPDSTSSLLLHSSDLSNFRNVTLVGFDSHEHALRGIRITSEHAEFMSVTLIAITSFKAISNECEGWVLRFDWLWKGEYVLHIGEYVGEMGDGAAGLFTRGASLYTHLQPSFARRLLPCIDTPSVRAPFRMTIEHSQNTVAFSNTGSVEERLCGSRKRSSFAPTPSIPAYLVAFSVLPDTVHQLTAQTSFGVTVRVIGFKQSSLLRVLRTALSAFEYLADMIMIPLPLNKMDLVLVDSYEGGMENWGHVLLSSSLADHADDAHLVHLVAHELTHHWIGNAASVSSWEHICLQEDLTEVFAHKVVKHLLKKEDFQRFRLAKYIEIQIAEDIVSPRHPLTLPQDITPQMIWTHCYLKGVIHLETIQSIIGEEALLSIVQRTVTYGSTFNVSSFSSYLKSYVVEGNVTLADIYRHYYSTGGYPSIDISVSDTVVRMDQSASSLWPLRLSFSDGSARWMMTNSEVFTKNSSTSRLKYLVNLNYSSFIRVNYDNDTWNEVLNELEARPSSFSPVTRAQFISDLCFFSTGFVDKRLVDRVTSIVYSHPHYFDLCDWSLMWCRQSMDLTASSLLHKALVNLSSFFTSASDYKCRSGQAIYSVNRMCKTFFGRECI